MLKVAITQKKASYGNFCRIIASLLITFYNHEPDFPKYLRSRSDHDMEIRRSESCALTVSV